MSTKLTKPTGIALFAVACVSFLGTATLQSPTGEIRGVLQRMLGPLVHVELRTDQAGPALKVTDAVNLDVIPPSKRSTFEFKGLTPGPYFVRAPSQDNWGEPSERVLWVRSGETTTWTWAPLACPATVQESRFSDDDIATVVRIALTANRHEDLAATFNLLVDSVPVPALKRLPSTARLVTRTELLMMASRNLRGLEPYIRIDLKSAGECLSARIGAYDEHSVPPTGAAGGASWTYHFKRNGAYWDFDVADWSIA